MLAIANLTSGNVILDKPQQLIVEIFLARFAEMDLDCVHCPTDFFGKGVAGFLVFHKRLLSCV